MSFNYFCQFGLQSRSKKIFTASNEEYMHKLMEAVSDSNDPKEIRHLLLTKWTPVLSYKFSLEQKDPLRDALTHDNLLKKLSRDPSLEIVKVYKEAMARHDLPPYDRVGLVYQYLKSNNLINDPGFNQNLHGSTTKVNRHLRNFLSDMLYVAEMDDLRHQDQPIFENWEQPIEGALSKMKSSWKNYPELLLLNYRTLPDAEQYALWHARRQQFMKEVEHIPRWGILGHRKGPMMALSKHNSFHVQVINHYLHTTPPQELDKSFLMNLIETQGASFRNPKHVELWEKLHSQLLNDKTLQQKMVFCVLHELSRSSVVQISNSGMVLIQKAIDWGHCFEYAVEQNPLFSHPSVADVFKKYATTPEQKERIDQLQSETFPTVQWVSTLDETLNLSARTLSIDMLLKYANYHQAPTDDLLASFNPQDFMPDAQQTVQ